MQYNPICRLLLTEGVRSEESADGPTQQALSPTCQRQQRHQPTLLAHSYVCIQPVPDHSRTGRVDLVPLRQVLEQPVAALANVDLQGGRAHAGTCGCEWSEGISA